MQGPSAPSPTAIAGAQGAANREAAVAGSIINNVNEISPFGNVNYSKSGTETIIGADGKPVEIPRYTRTTTLSGDQQALLDQQNQAGRSLNELAIGQIGRIGGVLNTPFSFQNLPSLSTDYSADRQRVEDALMSRLEPMFARDEDRLRTRLAVQGNTQGSEIYNDELEQFGQARTDARMQAILGAAQEQDRLHGLASQTRDQLSKEQLAVRNQPINEIGALLSGGQVSVPQFSSPFQQGVGSVPIGDYMTQDYQNRVGQHQANMSGMFGLGSTLLGGAFGLSDKRAKTDAKKVGSLPIYKYRYKGESGEHVGPMAQDVEKVMPHAVARMDGRRFINYGAMARG